MEAGQRGLARSDLSDALNKPEAFKPDDWPSQIGNFLMEKITQQQLMDKAKADNPADTQRQLCEGWFYAGMYSKMSGDSKGAQDCLKNAIATGSKSCEEYVEATRELAKLQQP